MIYDTALFCNKKKFLSMTKVNDEKINMTIIENDVTRVYTPEDLWLHRFNIIRLFVV